MAGRRGQHERIVANRRAAERRQPGVKRENGRVEIGGLDLIEQPIGLVLAPDEMQLRQRALECRRDFRQQVRTDGRNHADAQRPPQRIALPPRRLAEVLCGLQQLTRAVDDRTTGAGHAYAARVALEDLHTERRFDLRHLGAERRLGHAARVGGAPEAAEVGDGDQVLQLAQ